MAHSAEEQKETKGALMTQIELALNEDDADKCNKIMDEFLAIPIAEPYAEILDKTGPGILKKYLDEKFEGDEEGKTAAQAHVDSIFKAIKEKTALPVKVDEAKVEEFKAGLAGLIGGLMGAGSIKKTPDFADILT